MDLLGKFHHLFLLDFGFGYREGRKHWYLGRVKCFFRVLDNDAVEDTEEDCLECGEIVVVLRMSHFGKIQGSIYCLTPR